MNKEIKELWLTALRSGEYQQGTGTLRFNKKDGTSSFCCLGVLCDLAEKAGVTKYDADEDGYDRQETGDGDVFVETAGLPSSVQEWAGMENDCGELQDYISTIRMTATVGPVPYEASTLIGLNDVAGFNFLQIADVIEEQF